MTVIYSVSRLANCCCAPALAAAAVSLLSLLMRIMTQCLSPPLLTREDWEANAFGAEGFLLLLCCSALLAQMELCDK